MCEIKNLANEIQLLEDILIDVYNEYKYKEKVLVIKQLNKKMGVVKVCQQEKSQSTTIK
ncbi:MAG: hypothetical protein PHR96_05215 [Clostridia bacterium]|nr:hypothetical protein [Clostridia bacterium]